MKTLVTLLLSLTAAAHAANPPSVWQVTTWALNGNGNYTPSSAPGSGGDMSTFAFQPSTKPYASFLTTTNEAALLGDLTGKQIVATVSVSGSATFVYGGEYSWNSNSVVPANTRLYFSTSASPYDLNIANTNETAFWWSDYAVCYITNGSGGVISDVLDGSHWSDANGHSGADPAYSAAFTNAVQNVRQIGLSYGGGSFFDVGVALWPHTGTASFHLQSYAVQ